MAHPVGHARRLEVRPERDVVGLALVRLPWISCGPRSLPACGSIATTTRRPPVARQDDRRAPAEGADLDHHGRPRARSQVPQAPRLRVGQPAFDSVDRLQGGPQDHGAARGARRTTRPFGRDLGRRVGCWTRCAASARRRGLPCISAPATCIARCSCCAWAGVTGAAFVAGRCCAAGEVAVPLGSRQNRGWQVAGGARSPSARFHRWPYPAALNQQHPARPANAPPSAMLSPLTAIGRRRRRDSAVCLGNAMITSTTLRRQVTPRHIPRKFADAGLWTSS